MFEIDEPIASDSLSEAIEHAIQSLEPAIIEPVEAAVQVIEIMDVVSVENAIDSAIKPVIKAAVQGPEPAPFVLRGKRPLYWKPVNPNRKRLWEQKAFKFPINSPIFLEEPFTPYPADFDSPPVTPEPFG
jgi:hypothetical protein